MANDDFDWSSARPAGAPAAAPTQPAPQDDFDWSTARPAGTRARPQGDAAGPWYSEFGAGMAREAKGMAVGTGQLIRGQTPGGYEDWQREYNKPDPSWWTTAGRATAALGTGAGLAGLAALALPETAAGVTAGALTGAMMPTESGSLWSHLPGAALGAGGGWAGSKLGGLLGKAPYLRDFASWNKDAYSWILEGTGITTPKVAGTKAIAEMADTIGAKLGAANAQLELDPSRASFQAAMNKLGQQNFVQAPGQSGAQWAGIRNGVLGDLQDLARRGGGRISGKDFADYITGLNKAARAFAESAASGSERSGDLRVLAQGLNGITEAMEDAAAGPAAAKAARSSARQAWSRFMRLADEQSAAVSGGLIKPSQMIGAMERSEGKVAYASNQTPFKERLAAAQKALEGTKSSGFLSKIIGVAIREAAFHGAGMPGYIAARALGEPVVKAPSAIGGWVARNAPYWPATGAVVRGLGTGIGALGGETLNTLANQALGDQ